MHPSRPWCAAPVLPARSRASHLRLTQRPLPAQPVKSPEQNALELQIRREAQLFFEEKLFGLYDFARRYV